MSLFQDKTPGGRNASPGGFLICCRLTGNFALQSFCCSWREKCTFVPELGFVKWNTLKSKTSSSLWMYKIKNGRKHSPVCSSKTYRMSPGQKRSCLVKRGWNWDLSHRWNTERQELVVTLSVRCKKKKSTSTIKLQLNKYFQSSQLFFDTGFLKVTFWQLSGN